MVFPIHVFDIFDDVISILQQILTSASIWRIAALILCHINQFINLKIYYYGTLENYSQVQQQCCLQGQKAET